MKGHRQGLEKDREKDIVKSLAQKGTPFLQEVLHTSKQLHRPSAASVSCGAERVFPYGFGEAFTVRRKLQE